ncbi:MAG TPA: hypothetical protein VGF98_00610 [Candidatus Tumulicola sp.]|jgi:hypothetical protein
MRYFVSIAALAVAMTAPAWATGTLKIQQNNNSISTYTDVGIKIVGKTLMLTSADKWSTVIISGGSCVEDNGLKRCNAKQLSMDEDGTPHVIPFVNATFYFNLTDADVMLPLSTIKIAPNSVIFSAKTNKGTYITGSGTIDGKTP